MKEPEVKVWKILSPTILQKKKKKREGHAQETTPRVWLDNCLLRARRVTCGPTQLCQQKPGERERGLSRL